MDDKIISTLKLKRALNSLKSKFIATNGGTLTGNLTFNNNLSLLQKKNNGNTVRLLKLDNSNILNIGDTGCQINFSSSDRPRINVGQNPYELAYISDIPTKQKIVDMIYRVGAIYMSVDSTSPASLFGGTWEAWGKDRVPIGVGSDSDFNTVEKTGGSKEYELRALIGAVGGNVNTIGYDSEPVVSGYGSYDMVIDASAGAKPQGASNTTRVVKSDGNPATTVQPYITCYMWKRVS